MEIDPQRFRSDDAYRQQCLDEILDAHAKGVVQYCVTRLGVVYGEDIAQEVFVTAMERLATFRPGEDPAPWLYGIARNKCRQWLRNRSRRTAIAEAATTEIREHAHADLPISPEHQMTQQAYDRQQRAALAACLSQLKADDQLLIRWRYIKGLSVEDIAALLDIREVTARKRLERAMLRLKEKINHAASG